MTGGAALCALLCLGALGCGGSTTVTGKVTHKSRSVVWGSVTLVDERGQYHQGPIALDGTYTVKDVPSGPVKIGVYSPNPAESAPPEKRGGTLVKGGPALEDPREKFKQERPPEQPRPEPGKWFAIPAKYTDPMTSGLSGTVKAGQSLDVELP
jgi:hypothetical protein